MSDTITRFIHLRYPAPGGGYAAKGGLTLAYVVTDSDKGRHVVYAAAKCHEADQFVKRIGRDKAAGRLKSKNLDQFGGSFSLPKQCNLGDVVESILTDAMAKWPMNDLLVHRY